MKTNKRIGTFTLGVTLVAAGIAFLLHIFGCLNINILLSLWPIVLILLGIEVLWFSFTHKQREEPLRYDTGAIFLMLLLLVASFVLEGLRLLIENNIAHWIL